ncbi:MAG TPA: hypothetical protein VGM17_08690 [Rhizomicrobium sp.]|jgi:hypothetical protein
MRIVLIATAALLAAPALAQPIVDPSAPWQDRMNVCVAEWNGATPAQRGTMTYRQFTTKCVGGQTALPIKTNAVCSDGNITPATSPDGACADDGGVARWLE